MELGPVTKLDKRNKATSKNFKDDVMSENCDICHFSNLQSIWSNSESWVPVTLKHIFVNSNI